ncbi:hypothetical protein Sipo8835_10120 [Streptomyces ipomoeae]|uniref:LPXTG cell wall anchor domain-containing protein n=1 Tax=Streptomyces ipomoeae TaxID=103232 RepID=A0AAE8W7E9_9ACTN|nr:hypothetical protein [Streptomyces ipomoeae]TQE36476.1 hypothetical protein Sipo8835_10120 [Streptomyces ipomoeae]
MRSARMLFATAAATAVLAVTAPGAYADGDKWEHEDNGYSKEHHEDNGYKEHEKDNGYSKEHEKDNGYSKEHYKDNGYSKEHHKYGKHDEPRGGIHAGGGALTAVTNGGDWDSGEKDHGKGWEEHGKDDHDKDSWKDDHDKGWKDEHHNGAWKDDHDKPHGGVHTGGGALASPTVTTGGLAALAVVGTGVYALRRRSVGSAA